MTEGVITAPETDVLAAGEITAETELEVTAAATEPTLVEADLLVEDVSIDGMCGVY